MSAVAELTRETYEMYGTREIAPVRIPAAADRLSLLRQAGDGRMPYPALIRLLGAATSAGATSPGAPSASTPAARSAAAPPDAPGSRPARPPCSR